jgi:hypothetical protein
MGANQSSNESRRFFKLIAKSEKTNGKQAIVEVVKDGDAYVSGEFYSSLSGFIESAEIKEFVFENETKKKCVLTISDEDGVYQLEYTFNFCTYGLINSMLAADLTKRLEVCAWVNKDRFVGAGLRYEGSREMIKWLIELGKTPKGIRYKTPSGKEEVDYTNVQKYWEERFISIGEKLKGINHSIEKKQNEVAVGAKIEESAQWSDGGNELEDLPF